MSDPPPLSRAPLGLCRNCRHFRPDGVTEEDTDRLGWDAAPNQCARWHVGYGIDINKLAANEVVVEGDEGWGMWVGPDFGCILWEQLP